MPCKPGYCSGAMDCSDKSWKFNQPRSQHKDLTGARFGRWSVLAHLGRPSKEDRDHRWLCRCDCGTERAVNGGDLRAGKSQCCGCTKGQHWKANPPALKHGFARTPTYYVWCGMRERCRNPNNKSYKRYGGRGIRVCERWEDYTNFLADMGERPAGLTLERKNNNGNYEPGNCVWATYSEQSNNRSINVFVEHNGQRLTVSQWAHSVDLAPELVRTRLRHGWPIERALQPSTRRKACPA
jgi:hypothetical protein